MARSVFLVKVFSEDYIIDKGVFLLYQDAIEFAESIRGDLGSDVWLEEWLDTENSGRYKKFQSSIELNKVRPLDDY